MLNPDCRVLPGALSVLAAALRQSGSGIAVPRLVNPDGSLQPSLRRNPTVGRALAAALHPVAASPAGSVPLGELVAEPALSYDRPGQ